MRITEAIKYYRASEYEREQNYGTFLIMLLHAIGQDRANQMVEKAESEGKFIVEVYDEDHIDRVRYEFVDLLPD